MNEQEQTKQDIPPVEQNTPPAPTDGMNTNEAVQKVKQTANKLQNIRGWSWGAFMFTPVFIIGTKKYKYLLAYLVLLIPFLGPLLMLGFQIYLGLNVKVLLEGNKMFTNEDEKAGFVKGINHAGFVSFVIAVVFFLIGILFFGAIIAAMFSAFGGGGASDMYRY
ncbi:MAG: hypothetical protein KAS07_00470 [Candidatus Pacebacteria bacterium]|nr:hypothetical protein [Candidatus Paceibacterota bacterium]